MADAVGEPPLLSIKSLSKSFPGQRALDDVSFDVQSGEIVALVGQNGSGKSTLVKVLTGIHQADPGARIAVHGDELGRDGSERWVHVIHQDLGLISNLSTIENLDLGRRYGGRKIFAPTDRRGEVERARAVIGAFGAQFDVRRPVAELTPAERSIVAIARSLDGWERPDQLLLLDEPTAALHPREVELLFTAVRRVAARGAGVLFISHRLDEVTSLAHRIVALRGGRIVADETASGLEHDRLIKLIVGRAIREIDPTKARVPGGTQLEARDLRGGEVRRFDVQLRAGEIVGVSGLLGSGREHVAALLFGAMARSAGEVMVEGRRLRASRPDQAIHSGLAYVPADRRGEGAVMGMRARENLTLPRLKPFCRLWGWLDGRRERDEAMDWAQRVELSPANPERILELFSGGNQQKVVLAKWLRNGPKVLLLDEPTQGVDVGAKAAVYELINEAAARGVAVLVSSTDTNELAMLCDRVIVLRDGTIDSELSGDVLTEERLVFHSLGLQADENPDHDES